MLALTGGEAGGEGEGLDAPPDLQRPTAGPIQTEGAGVGVAAGGTAGREGVGREGSGAVVEAD